MTNSSLNYVLNTVSVDNQNNTLVGGIVTFYGDPAPYVAASIQKIAPDGRVLWEFREGTEAYGGVEGLAVDKNGNVFFSVQLSLSAPRPFALIKLSPAGDELWRQTELYASGGSFMPSSTIKLDAAGNAFFLFSQYDAPGINGPKQSLIKFDSNGRKLWCSTLPGYQYFFSDGGISKNLALTPDGGAVIVGGYSATPATVYFDGSGFAAKIRGDGVLDWINADYKGKQKIGTYNSVSVGAKGFVCAASSYEGLTVFSANGKPLHTSTSGAEAVGLTDKGDFLVTQFREKFCAFKQSGAVGNLESYSDLSPVVSVISNGKDGFLATGIWRGSFPAGLGFAKLSNEGDVLWSTILTDVFSYNWYYSYQTLKTTPLARASDGSIRLITEVRRFYWEPAKPTIFAFAIEE